MREGEYWAAGGRERSFRHRACSPASIARRNSQRLSSLANQPATASPRCMRPPVIRLQYRPSALQVSYTSMASSLQNRTERGKKATQQQQEGDRP